jgi:hypothetical protein
MSRDLTLEFLTPIVKAPLVISEITYSKGRRDVKHHFIHLSRHPSVPSWSVYSDGTEKEWNRGGAAEKPTGRDDTHAISGVISNANIKNFSGQVPMDTCGMSCI